MCLTAHRVLAFVSCVYLLASGQVLPAQSTNSSRGEVIQASAERTAYKIDAGPQLLPAVHPLMPAYQLALECLTHVRRDIRDYSCMVIRRERVNGALRDFEYMQAKVRHERSRQGQVVIPFSVYLKFLKPGKLKGREVLFVDGAHDGNMIVRNGGTRFAFVTTQVSPGSSLALRDNRYPITEFGVLNLLERLAEVAREDMAVSDDCEVRMLPEAKVNGRECLGLEVVHPGRDSRYRFHIARIFMDNELRIPIHYESFDWPREAGGEPVLLEQYTYTNIKLNNGFGDIDFDPANPAYQLE